MGKVAINIYNPSTSPLAGGFAQGIKIMPNDQEQNYEDDLNQSRAAVRNIGGLKGKILGKAAEKLGEKIADKMIKAVEDKDLWVWPFAYALAIFTDFIDIILLGLSSIFLFPLKLLCMIILWRFSSSFNATGPLLGARIRILFWVAGTIELIPFISVIPTWTIGTLWLRHKIKDRAELAEKGLEQNKKGLPSPEILHEFAT